MKRIPCFIKLILSLILLPLLLRGQHTGLHFDGELDFIRAQLSQPMIDQDFTMETWFRSDQDSTNSCSNWACLGNYERLLSLSGPDYNSRSSRYEIGACDGLLTIFYSDQPSCATVLIDPPDGICIRDGAWHHIAMTKSGPVIRLYLDCTEVFVSDAQCPDFPAHITNLRVANWGGAPGINETWYGAVDETKLWNRALSLSEIEDSKHCPPHVWDPDLLLWYDYEEGIVGGDNTVLTVISDKSQHGHHGDIFNMTLTGNESNFVESEAILAESLYDDFFVEIKKYPSGPAIHEICDGDPVHFATFKDGVSPPEGASIGIIEWEYNDGSGWLPAPNPPYIGWNFPVEKDFFTADCANNADGFTDLKIRARAHSDLVDTSMGGPCEAITPPYDLRICCPITTAQVVVVPDTPICASGSISFDVELQSDDLFIQQLADEASVNWEYSLSGSVVPLSSQDDQLSFNTAVDLSVVNASTSLCFIAGVSNCSKTKIFKTCINVDPRPVCGELVGASSSLTDITTVEPHRVYEICPGEDAVLEFVGDDHCKKRWQYRFDGKPWVDEGSISNPQLNTNTLPWDFNWETGAEKIFYRVICEPERTPSGCPSVVCDSVEIRLVPTPLVPMISAPSFACEEDLPTTISVSNPSADGAYVWFHEGLEIGTGSSIEIEDDGCYRVRHDGKCSSVWSDIECIRICDINAVITCPQPACVHVGDSITLHALACTSSCEDSVLEYDWLIDGVPAGSVDQITHIPDAQGTTYTLILTDTVSGCTDTTSLTIIPCP